MWDADTPSITTSLRGLVYEEVRVTCADRDLHSGLFGGAARNPIHVLAAILSALHRSDGSVAIPGFYDGVAELPADIKADLAGLELTPKKFLAPIGLKIPAGENSRLLIEQISTRPTAEVNGIIGGYTGEGAPAFDVPFDNPTLAKAREALAQEWGKKAVTVGAGGSIPIVSDFKNVLGMDSLLVGFALDDDRVHSPNEKYDLKCFHKGIRSWVRILAALAAS
jgi:acetylornithine deacetylase/succinyl-diaminopimelate desuccinylase-like protein